VSGVSDETPADTRPTVALGMPVAAEIARKLRPSERKRMINCSRASGVRCRLWAWSART